MAPLILDGGFSRELIRLGAPFKQPEWSALSLMEAPDYVSQVHSAFAEAGADVLTTNSYALVPFHIGEERFASHGEGLAALAGLLAREAADRYSVNGRKVLVAGCLPPIFGSYEPDKFDRNRVQTYLSVLVRGLAPYVDFWLGETLSLIAEGEAVRKAIEPFPKPMWISFTLEDLSDPFNPTLRGGEAVETAARWALASNVEALLFNCSSPEIMGFAIGLSQYAFASHSRGRTLPKIGIYANTFEPEPREQAANEVISETRKELTPEAYASFAEKWLDAGAEIVGGCCGIGSEHIKTLAERFKKT